MLEIKLKKSPLPFASFMRQTVKIEMKGGKKIDLKRIQTVSTRGEINYRIITEGIFLYKKEGPLQ